MTRSEKHYIVEASAHGSGYVRETPAKLFSLEQAKQQAIRWSSIADTVGGLARVVDSRTNIVVWQP